MWDTHRCVWLFVIEVGGKPKLILRSYFPLKYFSGQILITEQYLGWIFIGRKPIIRAS